MVTQNLQINGSKLRGQVTPPSSLNETLFMMSLALLAPGQYRITTNCEALQVEQMGRLLAQYGLLVGGTRRYFVDLASQQMVNGHPDFLLCHDLPAGLFVLLPTLLRFGEAAIYLPDLPGQPDWFFDELLAILGKFGIKYNICGGLITLKCKNVKGCKIQLPPDSFLLSCLTLQGAVLAEGDSTLSGVATDSEFVGCCRALQKMGAMIEGVGSNNLLIHGVNALAAQNFTAGIDNRQLLAIFWTAVQTGGEVTFTNLAAENIELLATLARRYNLELTASGDSATLGNTKPELPPTVFVSSPYPELDIPALILLGARQHREFRLVSSQLPLLWPLLPILERTGLRLSGHGDTIFITMGRALEPFAALPKSPLQALWLIWAALSAPGSSFIYNGTVIDTIFSNLDLQLARLEGQIIRPEEDDENHAPL